MENQNLDRLFNPRSVAIVGASDKPGKVGTIITDNIIDLGYGGEVFFVNSSYETLKEKTCYKSLGEIAAEIDLAIIAVPAKFVFEVVLQAADKVKNFVIISAGFSETGAEGAEREKQLLQLAKEKKLNILGPNCLGFIAPEINLNASFAGGMPNTGNIAFVSQSGALAVALMDIANKEQLGFSKVISVGNKMQLNESQLINYFAADENTKVIGMYLEGIKDGSQFLRTAKKVSKIKPIVILKAGKTEKSQHAISSHTGALAGSDEIMDAAFEEAGIIRAKDLAEFFDLLTLISFTKAPKNNQVALATNAGGAGVLTTDAFKGKKIALHEFDVKIKEKLKAALPQEASVENPIDLLGDAAQDRYQIAMDNLDSDCGSQIFILTPQQQTPVEKIAQAIIEQKKNADALVATIFIGGEKVESSIAVLKQNQIPNFANPDSAINALEKYYLWRQYSEANAHGIGNELNHQRAHFSKEIIEKAKAEGRSALLFAEGAKIMESYGISAGQFETIISSQQIPSINKYPLVAKVDSDKVLHKSDRQGVLLNIKNEGELRLAIGKLQTNFPGEQILLQPMQEKQIELILGIKHDPIFGPVIVYGLGGIYTEVFKMVSFLLPPMDVEQIKQQVLSNKIGFLFSGLRGQAPYKLDEFVQILKGLGDFALENPEVKEFDINPLFIYNDQRPAVVVDIKIIF